MQARMDKIEDGVAYLEIEVAVDDFEKGMEASYRKVVKTVSLPGFRKGKVPRHVLEAQLGKEVLYDDAIEEVLPGAFAQAIDELKIIPIAKPQYDIKEVAAGSPLRFAVQVPVKPEVALGELEGLQITIPKFAVEDSRVDQLLEDMRGHYAESAEKNDAPAAQGDSVDIDFTGYVNDEAFEGGHAENYRLLLGSNSFIPGFEDQLVGSQAGDQVDVRVTFPEDYHSEDLAGKEALFAVTVKKVWGKKLRELNDEFVQEISEFDTLQELKDHIRQDLEASAEKNKQREIRRRIVDQIIALSDLVVAPAVFTEEAEAMAQTYDQRLQGQGLSLARYLKMTNMSQEQFIEGLKPEAERNVKSQFIFEKFIEQQNMTASEEEKEAKLEEMAAELGVDKDTVKTNLGDIGMYHLQMPMLMEKAMNYLIDKAVITESEAEQPSQA